MKKVLMVIAPKDFRDEELFTTKDALEKRGAKCFVASTAKDCTGMLGGTAVADLMLKDAREKDFDAIVFVGGGGSEVYFNNAVALGLARAFNASGKITAAICIAPIILANAGILKGKNATVWKSSKRPSQNLVESGGAKFTGADVEVDGNLVTASGPSEARKFGEKIAEKLGL